jgi:hypothetical protein
MVSRLSALHTCRFLSPGKFLVLIFVRRYVNTRPIKQLEGLGQLRNWENTSNNYTTVPPPLPSAKLKIEGDRIAGRKEET